MNRLKLSLLVLIATSALQVAAQDASNAYGIPMDRDTQIALKTFAECSRGGDSTFTTRATLHATREVLRLCHANFDDQGPKTTNLIFSSETTLVAFESARPAPSWTNAWTGSLLKSQSAIESDTETMSSKFADDQAMENCQKYAIMKNLDEKRCTIAARFDSEKVYFRKIWPSDSSGGVWTRTLAILK